MSLSVVLWEHEPLFAHTGFQEQLERPSQCDLVISILWSRLGTRLPVDFATAPGEPSPTGTEFEIRDALAAFRRLGRPNLLIYRRTTRPDIKLGAADYHERGRQFGMLDDFCRRAFYDEQGVVLVAHHPYAEPWDFERILTEHVRKWLLHQIGEVRARPLWTTGSPYRGLEVFEAAHRGIYFGRSQAVSELIKRLRKAEAESDAGSMRFLLVQGMSGVGKSSLIRAGLLPLLEGRAVEGIGAWRHVVIMPSDHGDAAAARGVFGALAERLLAALPRLAASYSAAQLSDRLRRSPSESAARLDGYLGEEATRLGLKPSQVRLLVFVDQLEECWSALRPEEHTAFVACLTALSSEGRIWLVATVRSDFIGRMEEATQYTALIRDSSAYTLLPPEPDELVAMIRQPALAAGLEWESRDGISLDQTILREAATSPESLPLLEYALQELYQRRTERMLTFAAYQELGRLTGGIGASADSVLKEQGEGAQGALSNLLRSLVRVDESGRETRRYPPLCDFLQGSPERELLQRFIERRLCVTDRVGNDGIVKFAHEALLHSWPKLADWLKGEKALLQSRDSLERDARVWDEHQRASGWLATTADRLAAQERLIQARVPLPEVARDFVASSRARAIRSRWLRRAVATALVVFAAVAALFGVQALHQRDISQNALATYFSSRAWSAIDSGHTGTAVRYALMAYDTARPRGEGLRPLLVRLAFDVPQALILRGHDGAVETAEYSPDGSRVVTSSEDGTARIWDATNERELSRLRQDGIAGAAFSPNGTRIVTSSRDGSAGLWDAATGRELVRLHRDLGWRATLSPDGTKVVTTPGDGTARIWDAVSGVELRRLELGRVKSITGEVVPNDVLSVAFTRDSARIVTGSLADARIWDVASGREIVRLALESFQVDPYGVRYARFSPDGSQVVAVVRGGSVRVWDSRSGKELARREMGLISAESLSADGTLIAAASDKQAFVWTKLGRDIDWRLYHDDKINSVGFSPDGSRLVTASDDRTVRVWSVKEGWELARLTAEAPVTSAAFSPDGTRVIARSADGTVTIWSPSMARRPIPLNEGHSVDVTAYSPDGHRIASVGKENTVRIWDTTSGLERMALKHDGKVNDVRFDRAGKYLLTASNDGTARIWDALTGREILRLNHSAGVDSSMFSPHEDKVITTSRGSVHIWDARSGGQLPQIPGDVVAFEMSPDESRAAVETSPDLAWRLWDVYAGREVARLKSEYGFYSLGFSRDSREIATSTDVGTSAIWDAKTGRMLKKLGDVSSIEFSADGTREALETTGDDMIKIVDARNNMELARMKDDEGGGLHVAFAAHDRLVIAQGFNGVSVWEANTGRELELLNLEGHVDSIDLSASGTRLLTLYRAPIVVDGMNVPDAVVKIWDVATGHQLARLPLVPSGITGAKMSPDETTLVTILSNSTALLWDIRELDQPTDVLIERICHSAEFVHHGFPHEEIMSDSVLAQDVRAHDIGERVCPR